MMPRDYHVVAGEILDALAGIEKAIAGKSFAQYASDWTTRRAVERGLEIVSEASRHLPPAWTDRHPRIPWPKVRSIGWSRPHGWDHFKAANRETASVVS